MELVIARQNPDVLAFDEIISADGTGEPIVGVGVCVGFTRRELVCAGCSFGGNRFRAFMRSVVVLCVVVYIVIGRYGLMLRLFNGYPGVFWAS